MKKKITVAIADDQHLVRNGIVMILNSLGFDVPIQASHGRELLSMLAREDVLPDLAVIDISMPIMDGFEAIRAIREKYPSLKCIVLSMDSEFKMVFKMINIGAKAYLLKGCTNEQMYETLMRVYKEGSYYDSFVIDSLLEYNTNKPEHFDVKAETARVVDLSARELEFIKHCCSDMTYKEMAKLMNISPYTVDNYREEIFKKLNVKSRIGIVLFAIRNMLYTP